MEAEFAELQARLRALWPNVTLRSIGDVERTLVVRSRSTAPGDRQQIGGTSSAFASAPVGAPANAP